MPISWYAFRAFTPPFYAVNDLRPETAIRTQLRHQIENVQFEAVLRSDEHALAALKRARTADRIAIDVPEALGDHRRSQVVDATPRPKTSDGFIQARLCRGRELSSLATAASSA